MTREEFRAKLSIAMKNRRDHPFIEIAGSNLDTIADQAFIYAEPLFEEIERLTSRILALLDENSKATKEIDSLSNDREQWKHQALESTMHASQIHAEALLLKAEILRQRTYIEALEHDVKYFKDMTERLEVDISDLAICENCGEEALRIHENNCFPPRYCHRCKYPELYKLFEKEVERLYKLRRLTE